jgi:hypothetical protein
MYTSRIDENCGMTWLSPQSIALPCILSVIAAHFSTPLQRQRIDTATIKRQGSYGGSETTEHSTKNLKFALALY